MFTEYTSCCGRSFDACFCEDEVTAVEFDEVAEARLVKSHGGFAGLLAALRESLRKSDRERFDRDLAKQYEPMNPKGSL